jgi:hypothetical protein
MDSIDKIVKKGCTNINILYNAGNISKGVAKQCLPVI